MKMHIKMSLNKQKGCFKEVTSPSSVFMMKYGPLLLYFWHCFYMISMSRLINERYEGIPRFLLINFKF